MRADYATSELISKVNSDWINEVLAHREFRHADPAEDVAGDDVADDAPAGAVDESTTAADDLRLRREFARKRAILLQRGATGSGRHEPDIAIDPTPRSRPRSVARRIKERLALAVAALAMVAAAAWMAPEPQDVTSQDVTGSVSTRAASAAPEPAAPVDTAELQPAWLVPEILYGPAMTHSPVSRPESSRPAPQPGR
jgi:hypothetical protein